MMITFALSGNASKASSRVRGYWIADELRKMGFACRLIPQHTRKDFLRLLSSTRKSEGFIFQKTFGRYHAWLAKYARKRGKFVCVDIDDAPSYTQSKRTLDRAAAMMREAHAVLAGSRNLLELAQGHKAQAFLVPSAIKLSNYSEVELPKPPSEEVCLGWIGNGKFYADDLISLLREPLQVLAGEHRIRLKIVGANHVMALHEAFRGIPNLVAETIDHIAWNDPAAVAAAIRSFDIGLYPLLPNAFNRYKCGFKALEYMACSLPVVASPVANNAEIVQQRTTGYLVESNSEWESALASLVSSKAQRQEMGRRGRRVVEEHFSTHSVAGQLAAILEQLRGEVSSLTHSSAQ